MHLYRAAVSHNQFTGPVLLEDQIKILIIDPRLVELEEHNGESCITTRFRQKQFPLCLYSKEDLISSFFRRGIYWEADMVSVLISKLAVDPDFGFIDIGANVGTYALAAAHVYQRKVVAVEATRQTSRLLARSVELGKLTENVTVLQNAIYGDRRKLVMAPAKNNVGAARAQESCNNTNVESTVKGRYCIEDKVDSITLNDLINVIRFNKAIMKIDAEGSEIDILTSDTSERFFRVIHIPVIQMEWVFYLRLYTTSAERRDRVDQFISYMQNLNYVAYGMNGKPLGDDWTHWPMDLLWQKKS